MLRKTLFITVVAFVLLSFWALATGKLALFMLLVCILGAIFYLCPRVLSTFKEFKIGKDESCELDNGYPSHRPPRSKPLVQKVTPPPITTDSLSEGLSITITLGNDSYGYDDDDFDAEPAEWIPFGRALDFKNYVLPGGFYFLNNKGGWGAESSAVAREAQVGKPLLPSVLTASYYPSYSQVLPDERATYLNWLQCFGRDQHQKDVARGYLFLYFYGLERRALCEGDLDPQIFSTVKKMLGVYGPHHQGRTIITYLSDFLYFGNYQLGHQHFAKEWPELMLLHGGKMSEDALILLLAHLHETQQVLAWELAYRLAARHDNSRSSVVTKRSGEKFYMLFQSKYEALYPEGLTLKAAKQDKRLRYRAANSSLPYQNGDQDKRNLSVPNVLGIRSQFKKLPSIWNECIDELSGYSRAMRDLLDGHDSSRDDQLKAFLALPPLLQSRDEHPFDLEFTNMMGVAERVENNVKIVPCSVVARLLGIEERPALTATQSRMVSDVISSLGHVCGPNPHHSGLPLRWNQDLALAPCNLKEEKDSLILTGTLRLLYLTIMVASADGDVAESELSHYRNNIDRESFSDQQIVEIDNTLIALSRSPQVALRSLNKICKGIHEKHREAVLKHLVTVAADDDLITGDELKILKRITKSMGLSEVILNSQLEELTGFKTVQVLKTGGKRRGEPIPQKKGETEKQAFSLDHDKIALISAETEKVVEILSQVLSDDEVELLQESSVTEGTVSGIATEVPDWLSDLNKIYQIPLLELIRHPNATGEVLKEVANKHHVMASSLIDEVNEWSDEALDDFLLELDSDENLTIYRELLPEKLAA